MRDTLRAERKSIWIELRSAEEKMGETDGRGRRDGQPALPCDSLWLAGLVSHRLIVLPLRKGVTRYGQRVERKMSRKQDKFYFAFYAFWSRYIHETRDKQKKFTRKSD